MIAAKAQGLTVKPGERIRYGQHRGVVLDALSVVPSCCRDRPCGKITLQLFPETGFVIVHVDPEQIQLRAIDDY